MRQWERRRERKAGRELTLHVSPMPDVPLSSWYRPLCELIHPVGYLPRRLHDPESAAWGRGPIGVAARIREGCGEHGLLEKVVDVLEVDGIGVGPQKLAVRDKIRVEDS